jgi:hypothetical protein
MQCAHCGVMRNLCRSLWSQTMWFEVHRINCGFFFISYYDYLWILVGVTMMRGGDGFYLSQTHKIMISQIRPNF